MDLVRLIDVLPPSAVQITDLAWNPSRTGPVGLDSLVDVERRVSS